MSQSAEQRLAQLRIEIDALDATIVEHLNRRAQLAIAVGEVKSETGAPVYRPEREMQVLAKLGPQSGALSASALQAIYREIMSACRELERRLRVAFLGPAGTFSEEALLKHFGSSVAAIACSNFDEVFRATEAGSCDFAVLPIENSSEGAVNRTMDLLLQTDLIISGELSLAIAHNLLTQSGSMAGISRICAHPQALAQCQAWLDRNAPGIERVPVASNAEGARLASLEAQTAAIAGERAAQRYGLAIAGRSIQDDANNRTRFIVIGRYACSASGTDQTSLILSVPDRAGAVHALIEPLARHGVSMKRFESRPARQGNWEYYFYIDVLGHQSDAPVAAALAEIKANASYFRIAGSYPRAI